MNFIKPVSLTLLAAALAACSSNKDNLPKLDYQSANKKVVSLDVPPDLTNPNQGDMYRLPANSGAIRASDLAKAGNRSAAASSRSGVLTDVSGVHMQRDGSFSWLNVSNKKPGELWPLLKAFWQEQGFTIASEEADTGMMETDWAENRAKLPADFVRGMLEKVGLGGVYSTGEKDKFIIRLERTPSGGTNIFFSQKGLEEVYTNKREDQTVWQPRANDPNLEAAFLARFMQYLGVDSEQVKKEVQTGQTRSSNLAKIDNGVLLLSGDQDRNMRRLALALDRVGLNVVGDNPERHLLLVEEAREESTAVSEKKPGFFGRMFGRDKKDTGQPQQQPRLLILAEPVQNGTRVRLLNTDGTAYTGSKAQNRLQQLYQQLR